MGMIFRPSSTVRDASGNPVIGPDGKRLKKPRTLIWWVRYYDASGKPHDESSKSKKKSVARRLLTKREAARDKGEQVGGHLGRLTFDQASQDHVNDLKINDRDSVSKVEGQLTNHLLPVFGGRRMASLTTSDFRQYIADRREQKAANSTINRELAVIGRSFTLALQAEKISRKPYVPRLEERNTRTGFFERQQFEAVRKELPDHLKPAATFWYWTGWRRNEVLGLEIRQIDLVFGAVRLDPEQAKNETGRQFVFQGIDELRKVLVGQVKAAERLGKQLEKIIAPVFHKPDGTRIALTAFYKAWHSACDAAGYPTRLPHDFRRTAVRNLERASVPRSTAKQMVGHKTDSVYERYAIVDDAMHQEASAQLGQVRPFKPKKKAGGQ